MTFWGPTTTPCPLSCRMSTAFHGVPAQVHRGHLSVSVSARPAQVRRRGHSSAGDRRQLVPRQDTTIIFGLPSISVPTRFSPHSRPAAAMTVSSAVTALHFAPGAITGASWGTRLHHCRMSYKLTPKSPTGPAPCVSARTQGRPGKSGGVEQVEGISGTELRTMPETPEIVMIAQGTWQAYSSTVSLPFGALWVSLCPIETLSSATC
jgi:hypothetical protein